MAGKKVLVLGATGPAGICLLRELVHRMYATVVFARTPSKIPNDLATNPLIEVRFTPWQMILVMSQIRISSRF